MKKTQKQAEKAAKKATQEILKEVSSLRKTLDFDNLHLLRKDRRPAEIKIRRIIETHIRDCFIASWIEEAEELEDLFGDELLKRFLIELYAIQKAGGKRYLLNMARKYSAPYRQDPGKNKAAQIEAVKKIPKGTPGRAVVIKAVEYTYSTSTAEKVSGNFGRYEEWVENVNKAPKEEREKLAEWRTGSHGESGLGYAETSLLRTESDTAQAEASLNVYEEAGVPRYRYNAMLDGRTCDVCKGLHGKIFPVSKKQPGENFPPIHNNCRCYIEPVK